MADAGQFYCIQIKISTDFLLVIFGPTMMSLFDLPARLSAEAKGRRHNHRARASQSSSWEVFRDRSSESGSVIGLEIAFLVSYQINMSCVEVKEEESTDV